MFDRADTKMDAPKVTDSHSALIDQVSNERNAPHKDVEQKKASEEKANALFGTVTFFDSAANTKPSDNTVVAATSPAAQSDGSGTQEAPKPKDTTTPADTTPAAAPVDKDQMGKDATALHDACGTFKNNNEEIYKELSGKTPEQLQAMNDAFKAQYGKSIEEYLQDQMKRHPDELSKAMTMLEPLHKSQPANEKQLEQDSDSIYKACGTFGNNDAAIYKALEGKTPAELKAMNEDFTAKHGVSMEAYLNDQMKDHQPELSKAMDFLHNGAASTSVPAPEYHGEGIKKDIEPSKVMFCCSDKVEDIAKQKLGAGASKEEIDAYTKEIRKVNHMDDPGAKTSGYLDLPGANKDGAMITKDADGTTHLVNQDGSIAVTNKDGTGYEMKPIASGGYEFHHHGPTAQDSYDYSRTPDGHGGYVEKHSGKDPKDNYEITRTPDGHYKIKDAAGERDYNEHNPDARIEKQKLIDDADGKITDPEKRAKFHADIERFEERARHDGLSPEQQAKFYHQVEKLFEASDNHDTTGLSDKDKEALKDLPKEADRIKIAEQIMTHASNPHAIDQGDHGSCGAAALESQMFTKDPADAAKLIAEVATQGYYTTNGGKIYPDKSLIQPDLDAQIDGVRDGHRSYASQIFQDTAIYTIHDSYHRDLNAQNPNAKPPDNGDRYKENGVDKTDTPALTDEDIQRINHKIASSDNNNGIIGMGDVKDEADMKKQLTELKRNHQLPAVIYVNAQHQPFLTDSAGDTAAPKGGAGGGHFITITDYDEKTGKVSIANQWGRDTDHTDITTQELYLANQGTPTPESIKELQKTVDQNRKNHTQDPMLELELAREKKAAGMYKSDAEFEAELVKIMVDERKHWIDQEKHGIPIDKDEQKRVENAWNNLANQLPEEEGNKMTLKYLKQTGYLLKAEDEAA